MLDWRPICRWTLFSLLLAVTIRIGIVAVKDLPLLTTADSYSSEGERNQLVSAARVALHPLATLSVAAWLAVVPLGCVSRSVTCWATLVALTLVFNPLWQLRHSTFAADAPYSFCFAWVVLFAVACLDLLAKQTESSGSPPS
jgi:hypothetical protein